MDASGLCINDWVIAALNSDYFGLVGQIIAIDQHEAAEHDTKKLFADVHVNFSLVKYTEQTKAYLLEFFNNSGSSATHFEQLPLDDVIVSPDMLIRLSERDTQQAYHLAESYDAADSYCNRIIDNLVSGKALAVSAEYEAYVSGAKLDTVSCKEIKATDKATARLKVSVEDRLRAALEKVKTRSPSDFSGDRSQKHKTTAIE